MKTIQKILIFISSVSLLPMILISCNLLNTEESSDVPLNPEENYKPEGMVKIAAKGKTFSMGDTKFSNAKPVHQVTFTYNYWIDTVEVTQGQYKALMTKTYNDFTEPSWNNTFGAGDNYPVYYVNWYDAVLYCNAKTIEAGSSDTVYTYTSISGIPGNNCFLKELNIDLSKNGFRLPTEAEWEYACRAGTTTNFYWEKDYNPYPKTAADSNEVNAYAVWYGNSSSKGSGNAGFGTHPVGTKKKNGFGLYDMNGNVWEWCNDWHSNYIAEPQTDPAGPDDASFRTIRGGSWTNDAIDLRSASRYSGPDSPVNDVGFRVCLTAK